METPSALLIRLPEHFGRDASRALAGELDHHLLTNQPSVIVDLSRVKQMDRYGLDMLHGVMVKVTRQDGTVQLGEISPEAAIILELTRMDGIFDMFSRISEDAAILHIATPQGGEHTEEEQVGTGQSQPLAA
jgi:anti-anti-sigma regulatory factor